MPTPIPQLSMADLILRFRSDCAMTHDFVKGDATLDIIGEDGTYPSLAKIVANIQIALALAEQAKIGFIAKTYTFESSMSWTIQHPDIISSNFTETITNIQGDTVHAPRVVISDTEFVINFTEPEAGTVNVIYYLVP